MEIRTSVFCFMAIIIILPTMMTVHDYIAIIKLLLCYVAQLASSTMATYCISYREKFFCPLYKSQCELIVTALIEVFASIDSYNYFMALLYYYPRCTVASAMPFNRLSKKTMSVKVATIE